MAQVGGIIWTLALKVVGIVFRESKAVYSMQMVTDSEFAFEVSNA